MVADITVLTVAIPTHTEFLRACVESVYAQTVPVKRHLICAHRLAKDLEPPEEPQISYVHAKNDLLKSVDTEWIAVLGDDDLWLPHHVETIVPALAEADVVYTWDESGQKPRVDIGDWSKEQKRQFFHADNCIDGTCAFRTSAIRDIDGFPSDWVGPGPWEGGHFRHSLARFEDHRAIQLGIEKDWVFKCIPTPTWMYSNIPGLSR